MTAALSYQGNQRHLQHHYGSLQRLCCCPRQLDKSPGMVRSGW